MARIRSIHPGFFLDNAFISSFARLLFLGLGSYADDAGIFEWKPKHLRIKILPQDRVNMDKLLSELEEEGMIESYQVDGKKYGLIRNFTKWQKPKNPVYKYPSKDVQMHANCGSDVDQTLVNCGSDDSLMHGYPEKQNKNNELQKKLPTGGGEEENEDRRGKKESPLTPQSEIMTMTEDPKSVLFNESLILLSQTAKLEEEKCRPVIGRWLKQLDGNADMLISLIDKGLLSNAPIPYISKMVANASGVSHRSNVAYFQPRKTNKQQMTEAWGLCESMAEFQEKYGDDEPTLEQLQSHNPRKAWGA